MKPEGILWPFSRPRLPTNWSTKRAIRTLFRAPRGMEWEKLISPLSPIKMGNYLKHFYDSIAHLQGLIRTSPSVSWISGLVLGFPSLPMKSIPWVDVTIDSSISGSGFTCWLKKSWAWRSTFLPWTTESFEQGLSCPGWYRNCPCCSPHAGPFWLTIPYLKVGGLTACSQR